MRMILERTGDSRWYMKYTDLCASADEWGGCVAWLSGGA